MVSWAYCQLIRYPAYTRNSLCWMNLRGLDSLPIDSVKVRCRFIAQAAEDPIDAAFLAHKAIILVVLIPWRG